MGMDDDKLIALVRAKLEERIAPRPEPKIQFQIVLPVTEEQMERVLQALEGK